jgi:hypothetical protein
MLQHQQQPKEFLGPCRKWHPHTSAWKATAGSPLAMLVCFCTSTPHTWIPGVILTAAELPIKLRACPVSCASAALAPLLLLLQLL